MPDAIKKQFLDFPGGPLLKNPPANAGDVGLIPAPGGSHMPQSNWICALQLVNPAGFPAQTMQEKPL